MSSGVTVCVLCGIVFGIGVLRVCAANVPTLKRIAVNGANRVLLFMLKRVFAFSKHHESSFMCRPMLDALRISHSGYIVSSPAARVQRIVECGPSD